MCTATSPARADLLHQKRVEHWTRRHRPLLQSLARRWCRSPLDPDDLVQDTLERALRTPLPVDTNERAWLSRVMRNLFIDRLRQQATRRELLEREAVPTSAAGEPAWWEQLTEADVRAEVARLPPQQRVTFELFTFAGKSYDEIAEQLGISKNTVGTRVLRARQTLRARLTKRYAS